MSGEDVTQEERWYYAEDARRKGPFTREELLERLPGIDGADTWVRGPGVKRWTRAVDIPLLDLEAPEESVPPNPAFWLTFLFFRPATFFRHFVVAPFPVLTVLCAWTFGMAGVIDRMEFQGARGSRILFDETWTGFWTFVVLAGIFAGLLHFAIGGWWYRVRLGWAGAREADPALARRVYLFASQIHAIPALIATLLETSRFDNPAASWESDSLWYLVLIIFPFWSVWNSYVGVRTAFVVQRTGALLWFLILPGLVYLLLFGFAFMQGAFALISGGLEPDVAHPGKFSSPAFSFSYPGNWEIDRDHKDYHPEHDVYVESIVQDAVAHIMVYPSEETLEEELKATLAMYTEGIQDLVEEGTFDRFGAFEGKGVLCTGVNKEIPLTIRVFLAPLEDGRFLEVHEVWAQEDETSVLSAFEQIRTTLKAKR